MSGKVTAVGLDVITERSGHVIAPVTPSVCLTPAAPAPIPVPYPVMGSSAEGIAGAPSRTKVNGVAVATVGACLKASHGNEPGALKEASLRRPTKRRPRGWLTAAGHRDRAAQGTCAQRAPQSGDARRRRCALAPRSKEKTMKKTSIAAVIALGATMIGADGCGLSSCASTDTCTVTVDTSDPGEGGYGGSGGYGGYGGSDVGGAGGSYGGSNVGGAGGSAGAGDAGVCMITILKFTPDAFPFVEIIPDDDPTAPAGGWQEATTTLTIATLKADPKVRRCRVHIGMPLRAEAWGVISPETAGLYSANVANAAAATVRSSMLPPGLFCSTFKDEMSKEFKATYSGLGARMQP